MSANNFVLENEIKQLMRLWAQSIRTTFNFFLLNKIGREIIKIVKNSHTHTHVTLGYK